MENIHIFNVGNNIYYINIQSITQKILFSQGINISHITNANDGKKPV